MQCMYRPCTAGYTASVSLTVDIETSEVIRVLTTSVSTSGSPGKVRIIEFQSDAATDEMRTRVTYVTDLEGLPK